MLLKKNTINQCRHRQLFLVLKLPQMCRMHDQYFVSSLSVGKRKREKKNFLSMIRIEFFCSSINYSLMYGYPLLNLKVVIFMMQFLLTPTLYFHACILFSINQIFFLASSNSNYQLKIYFHAKLNNSKLIMTINMLFSNLSLSSTLIFTTI